MCPTLLFTKATLALPHMNSFTRSGVVVYGNEQEWSWYLKMIRHILTQFPLHLVRLLYSASLRLLVDPFTQFLSSRQGQWASMNLQICQYLVRQMWNQEIKYLAFYPVNILCLQTFRISWMLYHHVSCVVVLLTCNMCFGFFLTTLLFKQVMLLNNVGVIWKFDLMQSLD